MEPMTKILNTPKGNVPLPCFIPVTTFGNRFPLDAMVRPYINRLSPAIMVSHFYAQEMGSQQLPVFKDSGGFASLFKGSETYHLADGTHRIHTREGTAITRNLFWPARKKRLILPLLYSDRNLKGSK